MRVFIQNEAGSFLKHSHNEKTLEWKGATRVSRAYPWPYGFVLNTTADDGLNVDCFVLTKTPLRTGQVVECAPVGLMEQLEDGAEDHNVLAVIRGEKVRFDETLRNVLSEFVSHVFDHVPGKTIQAGRFRGKVVAVKYVSEHTDRRARGAT